MKTPAERAKEAQIAFANLVLSGPNQITHDRITDALRSVVATAELAGHSTQGDGPCRMLLTERDPALFEFLYRAVWEALMWSYPLGGVWPVVRKFLWMNLHYKLAPTWLIYAAAKDLRRAA